LRGSPLNLNGIRLKATFSRRETCRETAGNVHDAFSLLSAVADDRIFNDEFRRGRATFLFHDDVSGRCITRIWILFPWRRRTAFARSSTRDVFRRNEPHGAPFCAFRRVSFGKWKPRIRVLVGISTSRDFRLHLVWLAVVVNYGCNVSEFEKFKELCFKYNVTKKSLLIL